MSSTIRISVLFILHIVGFIGFLLPQYQSLFVRITPLHLCIISVVLFWEKSIFTWQFLAYFILAFAIGFGAEVLGVQKQLLFGDYSYSKALGIGYWGVPFVIGVLWVSVSYACNQVSMNLFPHTSIISIPAAAFLMTGFDYMIEHFAVRYGLWSWKNGIIPDFNYYSWFGVGLILSILYQKIVNEKSNSIASYFLLSQILFFVGLRMIR